MNEKEVLDVVKTVKKKVRERPDRTAQLEPGDATTMVQNAMVLYNLPAIDTNNAEEVSRRVGEYFQICAERDMKPSVAGLALALDVDRRRLWEWVNDARGSKPQAVRDTLKKAYKILNFAIEEYMQNGKINPVSGIFLMKNNFGYADKSEVVLTPNNPLGESRSQAELEQKYLDALPAESAEGAESGSAE